MNDLLSDMASDSGDSPDKLDSLDGGKLDSVARMAQAAANLGQEISDAEQLLKDKKQALHKITDEQLPEALEEMGSQGFVPSQLEKVEPMTLKAWLRERVEAGDPIPLDLFGAFISQRATIKRSK
jgi:hypothetical protein